MYKLLRLSASYPYYTIVRDNVEDHDLSTENCLKLAYYLDDNEHIESIHFQDLIKLCPIDYIKFAPPSAFLLSKMHTGVSEPLELLFNIWQKQ